MWKLYIHVQKCLRGVHCANSCLLYSPPDICYICIPGNSRTNARTKPDSWPDACSICMVQDWVWWSASFMNVDSGKMKGLFCPALRLLMLRVKVNMLLLFRKCRSHCRLDSSCMPASLSASWKRFSLASNFVNMCEHEHDGKGEDCVVWSAVKTREWRRFWDFQRCRWC